MSQVLSAIKDKRFLCSPNCSHQHWHLSSMCQRSVEVEWPHLEGDTDHLMPRLRIINMYCVACVGTTNFISCYGDSDAYTSYVNLDGKVHECHHLLLPDFCAGTPNSILGPEIAEVEILQSCTSYPC